MGFLKLIGSQMEPGWGPLWKTRKRSTAITITITITIAITITTLVMYSEVQVVGFPTGGDTLCVTRGVLSRIDAHLYAHPKKVCVRVTVIVSECVCKRV